MCKPAVRTLDIKSYGPCGFNIRAFDDACAAFTLGETWRRKIANVLRRWADKAEKTHSFTIVSYGPSQITFDDVAEGVTIGFNGASKYMNDLWRERVFGSEDVESKAILPTKYIP